MMNKKNIVGIVISVVLTFAGSAFATIYTFDDFSSLTTDPELSGYLADDGFKTTFSGDDTYILTDPANNSLNALYLGNNVRHNRTGTMTMEFNMPVIELIMEFDGMHATQQDQITATTGTWTAYATTLLLSGQTLIAQGDLINPGGSGIDDDLLATLTFSTPVYSVTFTDMQRAFVLDSFSANVVPEPMTVSLLGLGSLAFLRRRSHG